MPPVPSLPALCYDRSLCRLCAAAHAQSGRNFFSTVRADAIGHKSAGRMHTRRIARLSKRWRLARARRDRDKTIARLLWAPYRRRPYHPLNGRANMSETERERERARAQLIFVSASRSGRWPRALARTRMHNEFPSSSYYLYSPRSSAHKLTTLQCVFGVSVCVSRTFVCQQYPG